MRIFKFGLLAATCATALCAQVNPWDSLTALSLPITSDDLPKVISHSRRAWPQVVSLSQLRRQSDPHLQNAYRQASKIARTGRHEDAARAFASIVVSNPDYSDARNDWALELDALGDLDGATRELSKIVRTDPYYALAYTNLAVVLYRHLRYSEAEAVVRNGITRLGAWPKANLVLGTVLVAEGHWTDEARSCLKRAKSYYKTAGQLLRAWPRNSMPLTGLTREN